MAKTLYVGNLPWATTPQDLADLFGAHGQVISSRIIKDKETNRSRGFGFVEVTDEDATDMIAAIDGKEYNGRILTVNEAKSREQ
ncbi:MAG: RNA-binding protein [Peptococcia bacterium]